MGSKLNLGCRMEIGLEAEYWAGLGWRVAWAEGCRLAWARLEAGGCARPEARGLRMGCSGLTWSLDWAGG